MQNIGEIFSKISDQFFEGGNGGKKGADPNFKAPFSKRKPKEWEKAKKFRWVCWLIPENIIMVDYDNVEAFERRLQIAKDLHQNCIAVQSPNKGGHFYWRNKEKKPVPNNSGNKNFLTLHPIDYKSGVRLVKRTGEVTSATCVASISKEDGTLREVRYCKFNENGNLDEVPFYDLPLKSGTKHDFLGMKDGEGRQDGLFTYMNPMKASGCTYEQYLEVARLIDRYIFKDSIADEFDNATRREAWDSVEAVDVSQFYNEKQFLHNRFGDYLIEKYHIKKVNGYIYTYQNGVYVPGIEYIEKQIVKEIPAIKRNSRNEVTSYVQIIAEEAKIASPNLIAFQNGLFNVETFELIPHSPDQVVTNMIPWDYEPGVQCDLVDDVLNRLSCNDTTIRALLEEVGGACLYRDNTIGGGKAFILRGEKSNGKSTFISMLQAMLGRENVSNLDFKELDGKFSTAMLFGKLANLGDDISDSYKEDVASFKKIVTGEPIKAEEKGKTPFNFRPYVKLVFSANAIPRMNDSTGAALRRLLIIPLNANFTEDDPNHDPQIRYKLTEKEAVQRFINLSLEGLQRVLQSGRFTLPEEVVKEKDTYEKENNPVKAFVDEFGEDNIVNEPTATIFGRFNEFCRANNFREMNKLTFSKRINRLLETESKLVKANGKPIRVFAK